MPNGLFNQKSLIIQIDRIAHLIGGCLDGRLFSQIRQRLRQFRVGGLYNVAMQSVVKVVQSIVQINKAGTIQAFVALEDVAEYAAKMNAVFGDGACHILSVRKSGACKVTD